MFSRWDNMMQHTQTHRTNQPLPTTTPSQQQSQSSQPQRKQKIQQQQQQQQIHPQEQGGLRQRQQQEQQQQQQQQVYQGGLMSPISLGSPEQPHWDDIVEDQVVQEIPSCLRHDHDQQEQEKKEKEIVPKQRRLSVADLCNPIHLTLDEFEALEGFARFRETPLFYESLRDLANIACIEPKPSSLSSSSSSSPSPSSTSSSSSCSLSQYHYA
ncbi:hypothetical protein BDA99DRAFT_321385 [Phascolomyces articulosus]|uniref:Uncharacterized protein n=1 Tax=Phascolomyces articulosus TaxID=60185 RepID=A0AAD5KGC6_9FUNG|nr:hypothetical protein BDA99DRAFT_321385 [Phascolomyces articulosus]